VLPVLGITAVALLVLSRSEFDVRPERSGKKYNEDL